MKLKSVNFSASNAKRSLKFASVNENSLHVAFDNNDCLLFERIANDLVKDTQVYSLFVAFIRYSLRLFSIRCVYSSAFYSLMWMYIKEKRKAVTGILVYHRNYGKKKKKEILKKLLKNFVEILKIFFIEGALRNKLRSVYAIFRLWKFVPHKFLSKILSMLPHFISEKFGSSRTRITQFFLGIYLKFFSPSWWHYYGRFSKIWHRPRQ